jgi:hypothetical protein
VLRARRPSTGEGLGEPTASFDALVHGVEGEAELAISDVRHPEGNARFELPGNATGEAGVAEQSIGQGADRHLARARTLARALDSAVRVPGTNVRFGLDPVLGLLPGLGDAAGGALTGYLILQAARLGAPASVLSRMLGNVAVDTLGGMVPLVGDLFDLGWKANLRNLALLERHLERPAETRAASRGLVAAVLVGLVLVVAAGLTVTALLLRALLGAMG